MIAMLMRQEHAVDLFRRDAALLEPEHHLTRAQPAIDQDLAVLGRYQGAVPRAAAAEDGETEHARYLADAFTLHKWKSIWERELSARGITEGEDVRALAAVIEGAESSDFFKAAETIERVEIFGVTGRKLGRFQITPAQIFVAKCAGTTSGKEMEPEPAPISPRDALRFPEKRDEQQENEIGVHLRLEFKIAREFLRADLARAILELERGMERVIDFFDKHDEGTDVAIA